MKTKNTRLVSSRSISAAALYVAAAITGSALGAAKDWNTSNGMWNTSGNWLPGGAPTSLDSALIGSTAAAVNGTVTLNTTSTIASLIVTDGMTLDTDGFPLTVGAGVTVSGLNTAGILQFPSRIIVASAGPNPGLTVGGNLAVSSGARVELPDSGRLQVGGLLSVDAASTISGRGTINLTRNTSPAMVLDGTLSPGLNGLTINQNGTGLIDLDGGIIGDRTIDITAGNVATNQYASLTINGTQLADSFDDHIRIGTKNTLNMNLSGGWTMGGGSVMTFAARPGVTGYANLDGESLTMAGTMNVEPAAIGAVYCPTTFTIASHVNVAQDGVLGFVDGAVTFQGGTFNTPSPNPQDGAINIYAPATYGGVVTFNGFASQSGDASLANTTTINADCFDFDGHVESTPWSLSRFLTINADSLDEPGAADPRFNGTIDIYNGALIPEGGLEINLPGGQNWTMAGTLNLHGNGLFAAGTVYGEAMEMAGTMNSEFYNAIDAKVYFEAGSVTNINSGILQLEGGPLASPNQINGGVIAGQGAIAAVAGVGLLGNGTISAKVSFAPGSALIANGGTLTLAGTIFEAGELGANTGATLSVATEWSSSVADEVRLFGGTVTGATLHNDGILRGYGLVAPTVFNNTGTLSALGNKLLTIDPFAGLDLDGTVNAVNGDILVVDLATDGGSGGTAGVINVGPGHYIEFAGGVSLSSQGTMNLNGSGAPATVKGLFQYLHGNVNVAGNAVYDVDTTFNQQANISIPTGSDELTVKKDAFVIANSQFSGNGKLHIAPGARLRARPNANINVHVQNAGKMELGAVANAGTLTVKGFTQLSGGKIEIDLRGTAAGVSFDRLEVINNTALDGTLSLNRPSGYVPGYLNPLEIIHTGGFLTGVFEHVDGNMISPTKYLAVTYNNGSVFAQAALPGDANLDGSVNISDFAIMASNFNTSGTWIDGSFDGNALINISDFALLAGNFNQSVPADLPRGNAVPEPAIGLTVLSVLGLRRRKQA